MQWPISKPGETFLSLYKLVQVKKEKKRRSNESVKVNLDFGHKSL